MTRSGGEEPGISEFLRHHELVTALYRPMRHGDWELRQWPPDIPLRGYWSPARPVSGVFSLDHGANTWMSLMPVEIESQQIGISCAAGHVVIFGLGMGWAAAMTALRHEVSLVTVVERDPEVIDFHRGLGLFAALPDRAGDKVRIEQADAFDWRPDRPVDLLMPDIWLPIIGEGRVDQVRRMQVNVHAGGIYFWGQELEIARRAAAAGRALDAAGIAATVADFELPLRGPELPDYSEKLEAAARQWMRDQWFGQAPPGFD